VEEHCAGELEEARSESFKRDERIIMLNEYGFSETKWRAARHEARRIMIDRARLRGQIAYSELVAQIQAISFDPHDFRFGYLLGEISTAEDAAGRGMLSAVVVHKSDDMQPGPGFFELASELGRDTSDVLICWVNELKKVHAYWAGK